MSELSVSAEKKSKMFIYVSSDEEGDITNYLKMAKTKAEGKAVDKQPKTNNSFSEYPFNFVEKNYKRKSLEGEFQKKIQPAVTGAERTVTIESGNIVHRKHISGPIVFQTDKKKEWAPQVGTKSHRIPGLSPRYRQEIHSVE